jgi:hypothetical protein
MHLPADNPEGATNRPKYNPYVMKMTETKKAQGIIFDEK